MYKIVAYFALIFGIAAIYAMPSVIASADYSNVISLYYVALAAFLAALSMMLGGVSRFMSHRKNITHAWPAKLGIFLGAIVFVILAAMALLNR